MFYSLCNMLQNWTWGDMWAWAWGACLWLAWWGGVLCWGVPTLSVHCSWNLTTLGWLGVCLPVLFVPMCFTPVLLKHLTYPFLVTKN